MAESLSNKKIAILVADGFEQVELTEPKKALEQAGARTQIVSPAEGRVKGWHFTEWADTFEVDIPLEQARPEEFDALLLPGGVLNPDKLRRSDKAVRFVKHFFEQEKPVAAICHGPWLLVEAGVLKGRKATSFEAIKTDLKNAGANWVDEPAVVDGNLLTSRNPDDIPAFNEHMVKLFALPQPAIRR